MTQPYEPALALRVRLIRACNPLRRHFRYATVAWIACCLLSACSASMHWGTLETTSPAEYALSTTATRSMPRVASRAKPVTQRSYNSKIVKKNSAEANAKQVAVSRPSPVRKKKSAKGNAIGGAEGACHAALRRAGVAFQPVAKPKARGVQWPVVLDGTVAGIKVQGNRKKNAPTNYLDCRLARALIAWAPALRRAGVTGLQHYSMYRKGARIAGSGKVSSHARGMSIDVARLYYKDGSSFSILDDWGDRDKGEAPCTARPRDSRRAQQVRALVCAASNKKIFQTVITPHYNAAHDNHLHLEIAPNKASTWIR